MEMDFLKADSLPEFGVLCVHHRRTFSKDFCDANSTDLLFNCARHLLDLRNDYLLQHHTKHSEIQNPAKLTHLTCSSASRSDLGHTEGILGGVGGSCWGKGQFWLPLCHGDHDPVKTRKCKDVWSDIIKHFIKSCISTFLKDV